MLQFVHYFKLYNQDGSRQQKRCIFFPFFSSDDHTFNKLEN